MYERLRLSSLPMPEPAFRALQTGRPAEAIMPGDDAPAADAEPAYADGYADGLAAGRAEGEHERARLLALLGKAEALRSEPSEELAQLIAETVERLVAQIVGAVPVDSHMLAARAGEAARLIGECDTARTLWLHPDDVPLLAEAPLGLRIMADPAAERGSIRLDCSAGWIEHGTSPYLDALRSALCLKEQGA